MNEPKGNLAPVYFIADESPSMSGHLDQLNNGLESLHKALRKEPLAAASIRFAVIGFAGDSECYLPLSNLSKVEIMPKLDGRDGGTSYESVFNFLYDRLPQDIATLKQQGYSVYRPSVFFLTDGSPTDPDDDWKAALSKLKGEDFHQHPNIVAFGIGDAVDPETIVYVATHDRMAFKSAQGSDTGVAIVEFSKEFTHTLMKTAQRADSQDESGAGLDIPVEKPEGFVMAADLL